MLSNDADRFRNLEKTELGAIGEAITRQTHHTRLSLEDESGQPKQYHTKEDGKVHDSDQPQAIGLNAKAEFSGAEYRARKPEESNKVDRRLRPIGEEG
jgi:hypothetical protein